MTKRLAALAVAALAVSAASAARADFAIAKAPATAPAIPGQVRPGQGVVADSPHIDPGDRRAWHAALMQRRITAPAAVTGFGDQIPLSFACRQIVPPSFKVTYGPGADPGMIVTWNGGDTWPHVLAAAIKPLGLHMLRSGQTVRLES
ncbi:MAG: hypothetical protein ABI369_08385 [Acetobacteraceae bacterium]